MRILHLYHDIMNFYGDYANVEAVKQLALSNGVSCTVDKVSLGDDADFSQYDFIFMGSATDRNQIIALEDFRRFSLQLKDYVESGKVALFTGSAFEILGKSITENDKVCDGLGLFDFEVTKGSRVSEDIIVRFENLKQPLVGYRNKRGAVNGITSPLFEVLYQNSKADIIKTEGVRKNNLFATHLLGPVLIKNPHFLVYITQLIVNKELSADSLKFNQLSFDVTFNELNKTAQLSI